MITQGCIIYMDLCIKTGTCPEATSFDVVVVHTSETGVMKTFGRLKLKSIFRRNLNERFGLRNLCRVSYCLNGLSSTFRNCVTFVTGSIVELASLLRFDIVTIVLVFKSRKETVVFSVRAAAGRQICSTGDKTIFDADNNCVCQSYYLSECINQVMNSTFLGNSKR